MMSRKHHICTHPFLHAAFCRTGIGIYTEGADLTDYSDWVYHHGTQSDGEVAGSGTVQFTPTDAGSYYFAFLSDNGYDLMCDNCQVGITVQDDGDSSSPTISTGDSSTARKGWLSCSKTVPFFSKTQVTGRSLREAPSRSPSPVPYRLQTGSVITPMQRQRQKITWIWSTRLAPSKTDPQIPMRAVSITDVHLRGVVVGRAIGEKR